jgi:hypothetical protein
VPSRTFLAITCLLAVLAMSVPGGAAEPYSKVIAKIDPWTINFYTDSFLAFAVGGKCAAIQRANGADIEVTADPDHPDNLDTVKVFVAFADAYEDARLFVDDGLKTNEYLHTIVLQRHGRESVFSTKQLSGDTLFVTFSRGTREVGRYGFKIGDIKRLSRYLHQEKCLIHMSKL